MPLFDHLNKHPQLQDHSSFTYLLLKRLALSEVIAATRLQPNTTNTTEREANIAKKIRDKCAALPPQGNEPILAILMRVISIATLIQNAWRIKNRNTAIATIKENTLALANSITLVSNNETNLLSTVREHSSHLTDLIIEALIKPEKIEHLPLEQLDLIEPILVESFPDIDISKLKQYLTDIRNHIDFLKKNIDFIHYDMVNSDNQRSAWSCRMS